MKKKTGVLLLFLCLMALVLCGCGGGQSEENQSTDSESSSSESSAESESSENVIKSGVSALGIDFSGMSEEEAVAAIEAQSTQWDTQFRLHMVWDSSEFEYKPSELGAAVDAAATLEAVLSGQTVTKPIYTYSSEGATTIIQSLADRLKTDAVDANISSFQDGVFTYTEEKEGTQLDTGVTRTLIKNALTSVKKSNLSFTLPVKIIEPDITVAELEDTITVIGEYQTDFYTGQVGRSQNIANASARLDGHVVEPGEEFSYNEGIGPMTRDAGYTDAYVISGGIYVLGVGGGVCQVATTLYNAVLLAELEVTDRSCHAYPSDYVPLGMDATVYDPSVDFKFVNNTDFPVYIESWCVDGTIGVTLYGKEIHDSTRTVSFSYEIVETYDEPEPVYKEDSTLDAGTVIQDQPGHVGYLVETYKTVTDNGVSTTEWFSESQYDCSPEIYLVGTKGADSSSSETSSESSGDSSGDSSTESSSESTSEETSGESSVESSGGTSESSDNSSSDSSSESSSESSAGGTSESSDTASSDSSAGGSSSTESTDSSSDSAAEEVSETVSSDTSAQ